MKESVLILIIEDDRSLARVLSEKLQRRGFETAIAYLGEIGLEIALSRHPNVIALDIFLPKEGGLDFLRKLVQDDWGRKVPVVVLTNLGEAEREKDAYATGANIDAYLLKAHFSLKDIARKIEEIVKK